METDDAVLRGALVVSANGIARRRRRHADDPASGEVKSSRQLEVLPADRMAGGAAGDWSNQLWGAGFIFPGGEIETLRLTRPLGVVRRPACCWWAPAAAARPASVTRNLGAWVTGMESDRVAARRRQRAGQPGATGQEVTIKAWDPREPGLRSQKPSSLPGAGAVAWRPARTDPGRPGAGAETRRPVGADRTDRRGAAGSGRPDGAPLGRAGTARSGRYAAARSR